MSLKEVLYELNGKQLNYISRAANMLCMGFGEICLIKDKRGREYEVSKFRIHVQCTWRMVSLKKGEILFARDDTYEPKKNDINKEDFDWDKKDGNLFDEKSNKWFKEEQDIYVMDVQITEINDIKLYFSNGDIFECFIDVSSEVECWRIIKEDFVKGDIHYVVTGTSIY